MFLDLVHDMFMACIVALHHFVVDDHHLIFQLLLTLSEKKTGGTLFN